ncbi:hypothetical protein JHK85_042925 [Glycine max]|nr:hypothetical protein JHK86_042303 [Glycine max]KAG4956545.1 hypothetical protein JHK85_042925 [Glycine max]
MQTQVSLISPLLEPFIPLYHNSNNVVGDMHLNAPLTTLSLSTTPMLSPYPASNSNIDNVHPNVPGRVQCNRCNERFEMEIDVESKLGELLKFIQKKKGRMHDRAPKVWVEPVLPRCQHCGRENSVEPLIADTKRKDINWLFLLLAQMLGCCTIKQLKYFCKHTNSHRTGAKDRLVYSTYMGLCKQLLPELFGSCS